MASVGACMVAVRMELDLGPLSNHDNFKLEVDLGGLGPARHLRMNRPGRVPLGAALNHHEDWAGSGSMDQLGRLPLRAFPIGKYAFLMTRKMHSKKGK